MLLRRWTRRGRKEEQRIPANYLARWNRKSIAVQLTPRAIVFPPSCFCGNEFTSPFILGGLEMRSNSNWPRSSPSHSLPRWEEERASKLWWVRSYEKGDVGLSNYRWFIRAPWAGLTGTLRRQRLFLSSLQPRSFNARVSLRLDVFTKDLITDDLFLRPGERAELWLRADACFRGFSWQEGTTSRSLFIDFMGLFVSLEVYGDEWPMPRRYCQDRAAFVPELGYCHTCHRVVC